MHPIVKGCYKDGKPQFFEHFNDSLLHGPVVVFNGKVSACSRSPSYVRCDEKSYASCYDYCGCIGEKQLRSDKFAALKVEINDGQRVVINKGVSKRQWKLLHVSVVNGRHP